MSRPAERVLALLEILQSRGLVPAEDLAARLEVDVRTVRRYAAALQEMGIPVQSVRGRYGGYRLGPGRRVPPVLLDGAEAVAVAAALTAGPADEAADRALMKITRVLPAELREQVAALAAGTAVLDPGGAAAGPDPEVVLTVAAAAHARRRLRITHRDVVRDVDPYGVVRSGRRWYLVGHDHLRDDVRVFRLDRVPAATALPRRVTVPADFDAAAHVREVLTFGAWTHRTEVWLDAPAQEVRRRLPATVGEVRPDGAGSLLVSGAEDLDGMARMLAGLPWRFAVRSPPALSRALAAHVAALAEAVRASR